MSLHHRIAALHRRLGPRASGRFINVVEHPWDPAPAVERVPCGWACTVPFTRPGDLLAALSLAQRAAVAPTPADRFIHVVYVEGWRGAGHEPEHTP